MQSKTQELLDSVYDKLSSFLDISNSPEKHVNNLKTCPKNWLFSFMGKNHLSLVLNLTKVFSAVVSRQIDVSQSRHWEKQFVLSACHHPFSLFQCKILLFVLWNTACFAWVGCSPLPGGGAWLSFSKYSKCLDAFLSPRKDYCWNKVNKNHFQYWNECWGLKECFFSFQGHCG